MLMKNHYRNEWESFNIFLIRKVQRVLSSIVNWIAWEIPAICLEFLLFNNVLSKDIKVSS